MGRGNIPLQKRLNIIKAVKRLSLTPLPISQYTDILFDLIGQGVLCTEHRLMQIESHGHRLISRHIDIAKYNQQHQTTFSLTDEERGIISFGELLASRKSVLLLEDIALPNYFDAYLYNEINKRLNFHYPMMVKLKTEHGMHPNGVLGLFRSKDMPPFDAEDASFMAALVPFISYGMSKIGLSEESCGDSSDVVHREDGLRQNCCGSLLMDKKGNITYLNDAAKNIFFEMLTPDEPAVSMEDLECNGVMAVLRHIDFIVRNIFEYDSQSDIMPVRVYTAKTGKSIIIKGYYMRPVGGGSGLAVREVLTERLLCLIPAEALIYLKITRYQERLRAVRRLFKAER
jgi:hypothetical protein